MPESPGRARRGPRRALTEEQVLDAALSLLDDGGANAASVRGIAARVGVAPNAVYTYFPDKAAVERAVENAKQRGARRAVMLAMWRSRYGPNDGG